MDLHAAGYVHRDLKPANIMWLPSQNRWTLIDFGCAVRIGSKAHTGFTLAYAAPEAVRAHYRSDEDTLVATEALDAWSVGVLAVELFTGRPCLVQFQEGREKVCTCVQTSMCYSAVVLLTFLRPSQVITQTQPRLFFSHCVLENGKVKL
jgi:serine/threonine protein kinase